MVEFSIVCGLLILLVGAIIDAAVFLGNYSFILHRLGVITQNNAMATSQTASSCADVAANAQGQAQAAFPDFNISNISALVSGAPPVLDLEGDWEVACFFCQFLPPGHKVHLHSSASVERGCP